MDAAFLGEGRVAEYDGNRPDPAQERTRFEAGDICCGRPEQEDIVRGTACS